MSSWVDLISQDKKYEPLIGYIWAFHSTIIILLIIFISVLCGLLGHMLNTPKSPIGWSSHDYDGDKASRKPLTSYITDQGKTNGFGMDNPINQFSVATAHFGGIFTEPTSLMNSWSGSASTEAASLQVKAGARAIVLDIWPDPQDLATPVVCAMRDMQSSSSVLRQWTNKWGLGDGVGRYSTWDRITRNNKQVGDILSAIIGAAFDPTSSQNSDPFFLILHLHGPTRPGYLDTLGNAVNTATTGKQLLPAWQKWQNQKLMCKEPIGTFTDKVTVIVIPPELIDPHTSSEFQTALSGSVLGQVTNYLELTPGSVSFDPSQSAQVGVKNVISPCNPNGGATYSPAQAGLCLIQPSVGANTDNDAYYNGGNTFDACIGSGAQFVAVNLFSPNSKDQTLTKFFDTSYFGTYSFKYTPTA